jgi:myo-inositol-1(or 4)-monophosphatase
MTGTFEAELDVAVDAARQAGRIQMERYERLERIVHKSERDVVTEVDLLSEELIIAAVRHFFPGDGLLAEESGRTRAAVPVDGPVRPGDARVWVIDPLDGTINYANGIPVFCVSIALTVGGQPVLGVIHDPTRNEMFTALAGRGAQLDGAAIRHPAKPKLSDAVVSLALPPSRFARREARIRKQIRVARNMGSASLALAYVGNGRFDAFVQPGGLSVWDICAAGLIASEGGATVTDGRGGAWFDIGRATGRNGIVAAAPDHHATFLELLR